MDLYPLLNSLRIALSATALVLLLGIPCACFASRLPRLFKGVLDVVLTLPLVLPPTVVGYFLLRILGPKRLLGAFLLEVFELPMTMVWYAGILSSAVVAFPLMYRTARGAFESYDHKLSDAARTLGRSEAWIFFRIQLPCCANGLLAGAVLSFARALGEYGATSMIAGYTPGKTATISTTVYQLWRTGDDEAAMAWVAVNVAISAAVLLGLNLLERRKGRAL